jgi:hypothetical protein
VIAIIVMSAVGARAGGGVVRIRHSEGMLHAQLANSATAARKRDQVARVIGTRCSGISAPAARSREPRPSSSDRPWVRRS